MAGPPVIAVDGPAASGKGTIARALAERYGFAHLDTGKLYRAVAYLVLKAGEAPDDPEAAGRQARRVLSVPIEDQALRGDEIAGAASRVAALAPVRAALLEAQREFAAHPPAGAKGAVIDGRDIGTIVCPAAPAKLFITASPEVRAERRWRELTARGESADYETVLAQIRERDARDSARATAPLKQASDAVLLDTSALDIEGAVAAAADIVDRALPSRNKTDRRP